MNPILHVIDAFTNRPFTGNPAAVCRLPAPRDESWMQQVARELNLSETAFLHPIAEGYALRWFTPQTEVALCGHATLAGAFTLWDTGELRPSEAARFHTKSGWLTCQRRNEWIVMDFPAQPALACPAPEGLGDALGANFSWVGKTGTDYLVEVPDEASLRALNPNFTALKMLPVRGTIVTARSTSPDYDFVSRFFAPGVGVNEDPVTGSAHCTLGPYWQPKLKKNRFTAYQASARGGVVKVTLQKDRALLSGQAVAVSRVEWLV